MSSEPIRITKEEATSSHVDDLLKRQMSLRGDPGVTRDRSSRRWYYQNWFLLMLVGMLGAFLVWAAIEPFMDDMFYLQGPIAAIDTEELLPPRNIQTRTGRELDDVILGAIKIKDESILLVRGAKLVGSDGSRTKLNFSSLKVGDVVGVYVHPMHVSRGNSLTLGYYVVRSPAPQSASIAKLTLDQLVTRSHTASMLLFPLIAGAIGLFIGAADGLMCRQPRRALLCGFVGLLVGLVGGFVTSITADMVYAPLSMLAEKQSDAASSGLNTFGFMIQVLGRGVAWCLAGLAMGLGQGIALRSKRLLLYGLIGGVIGGLLGGLLFDPIDALFGPDKLSGEWSRLAGFLVIGGTVGAMIGVVELLARDAWLRMLQGPLVGKEFLLFKDVMRVGSSPRSDIYLFNDPMVGANHATIRAVGDECEIDAADPTYAVLLNNRPVRHARLRHGDNVAIGRTVFVFQRRKG